MNKLNLEELGFPYPNNVIQTFIGGSQLHGAKLEGKDDTDYYGVFVEPADKVLGIDNYEHFVYTTSTERHVAHDLDVTLYSLRKWAALAAKGNPSVLHFLFAKPEFQHLIWGRLALHSDIFIAKSHLGAFFGYANAQLQRLYNGRGPSDISRPFLESQYGYDTKYAMHIIRLLSEAKELMQTGRLQFPAANVEFLRSIRRGEVKLYEIEKLANNLEVEAREAQQKSSLPETVDRKKISALLAELYQDAWSEFKLQEDRKENSKTAASC